jgi:CheY-like chemotaxis protein
MTRILFIDDDILTLDLMGKVAELLGHEALLCSTGCAGLDMAKSEKPGLILVDLRLPDRDGIEVIQALRTLPESAATPIYLLSAGISTKITEAAAAAGADGCLEKPISLAILNQVINSMVKG